MCNIRLDARSRFPSGMEEYLEIYSWHFSKKMCEWAVSRMRSRGGERITVPGSAVLTEMLKKYGVTLENDKGYDAVYALAMAKADYFGSSVVGEAQLAAFVKDYIDDPDAYEGKAFTRFYADCIGSGTPIPWEEVM